MNSIHIKQNVAFCARPEYEILKSQYQDRILLSNFFRKGDTFGKQSEEFQDIIDVFELLFLFSKKEKPKVLVAGIGGRAQEPFSYLTVVKDIMGTKPLNSAIELNCVDLQPEMSKEILDQCAYFDGYPSPKFAKNSFKFIEHPPKGSPSKYRVNREILSCLEKVFRNPKKTKWNTKIEDFCLTCPDDTYDLISCKNTLLYVESGIKKFFTIKNFTRMLKPKSILITDDYGFGYISRGPEEEWAFPRIEEELSRNYNKLYPNIWMKLR